MSKDRNQSCRTTWEGCSVLLDINDGERLVFARLSPAATLKVGKKNCSLQPIIGCPFGSLFSVETGKEGIFLSRVLPTDDECNTVDKEEEEETNGELRDNRALVDNNTAQTLTGEDIEELRKQGATGEQIVEALIANSATFDKKTLFSQEKYRLRKQKKYAPKVLVRRPFVRSISDTYFKKNPTKIGYLRSDSLSLLLTMANITTQLTQTFCWWIWPVDMAGGLVTGAVPERLGGKIWNFYGAFNYTAIHVCMFLQKYIGCMSSFCVHIAIEHVICEMVLGHDIVCSSHIIKRTVEMISF
ncbi:hypothetical protein vseg_019799 [Gypsophila vaccaria]